MTKKIHSIKVDRAKCIGAVTCTIVAPQAFEMDSEGIAVVKEGVEKLDDNLLLMAAQSCPVLAIELFDDQGIKIFPISRKGSS